jgi:hypothetical protein
MHIGRYLRMEERRAGEPIPDPDEAVREEFGADSDVAGHRPDAPLDTAETQHAMITS